MIYPSSQRSCVATRVVSLLRFAELAKGRQGDRTQDLIWGKDHISWILRMTSAEMLRFLTQKLKSQSINEVQPFPGQTDEEDKDSGTESDDENAQFEELEDNLDEDRAHHDTSSYGSASPVNHPPSPVSVGFGEMDGMRTHELTVNSLDSISYTSDLDGHGWDFERHSSEEELIEINNREAVAEKRKWSQVNRGSVGDSAGSSDEEVRELLKPQPVVLSASPPSGVQKLHSSPQAKFFLANVSPTAVVAAISPRKRHRQLSTSDCPTDLDPKTVIQRPCLDFEKMQKTSVKKPCVHSLSRPKLVKIRTINGNSRGPKCLSDPAVFSFRSISSGLSPLTPVEEPSCAY
ncbi:uncharacterized protein LOC124279422 isoform X1 [Haliotis rubra]|uniref:uncharacterized protein LOC124279422 isoform X1 n=1 Tax=Haliotis rubra TaxID=36100 RepID=UPI001EE56B7F|nr:uncharacterized protein LOC124279422 isoform X1 [Haliotis rubra]